MPIRIEAYTLEGIVTGLLAWPGHLRDALEGATELLVEQASLAPLDGRPRSSGGPQPLVVDDLVLAVPDEEMPAPVHAAWHAIALEAGPYQIDGELATMPGFDPGRALARPTGTFVLLREVRIGLLDRPDAGTDTHAQALVNRYTVDAVEADLMLGFFFPGARISVDPGTAGASSAEMPQPATSAPTPPDAVEPPVAPDGPPDAASAPAPAS